MYIYVCVCMQADVACGEQTLHHIKTELCQFNSHTQAAVRQVLLRPNSWIMSPGAPEVLYKYPGDVIRSYFSIGLIKDANELQYGKS